jgi:Xaa-Pro aminopeptidase
MHGFGHWLGLDVHDVGSYKNNDGSSKLLEPGMVFTVEPGIYISEANRSVAAKWHNIGIRIEDNILITEKGCKVLTDSLPKDINDLRQIIGSAYA